MDVPLSVVLQITFEFERKTAVTWNNPVFPEPFLALLDCKAYTKGGASGVYLRPELLREQML